MEQNLTVSIIVPVYNVYQYLEDCLNSILYQDIDKQAYEIIIVDDCSPYNESIIINSYLEEHDNIKYVRHDVNKRLGGARNTGMRNARGEYVMFLDSDDFLVYKNVLSILVNLVKKKKPIVLRSDSFQIIPPNVSYYEWINKVSCINPIDSISYTTIDYFSYRMSGRFSCSACATLYKRTFLIENGLYFREDVQYEDTDWTQKVLYYAEKIELSDWNYYGYRQTPDSITRGFSVESFQGAIKAVVETKRFYESIEIIDKFRVFINEKIIDNTIGFLKFSRNYPVKVSHRMLNKINSYGLTSMKSLKMWKNVVMSMMKAIPLLCVVVVRLFVSIKRLINRNSYLDSKL